jgi:hypothetical protein
VFNKKGVFKKMIENLKEMVTNLNDGHQNVIPPHVGKKTNKIEHDEPIKEEDTIEEKLDATNIPEISLINFYDWYEGNSSTIHNVARVKAEVSNINVKDSIIFKIQKGKPEDNSMELVSFYNPGTRPILNLPPVYIKVFKNDTFEVLHSYSDEIFIKSYGVKTGLILVFCANVDGKIVPYHRIKIKKNVTTIKLDKLPNIPSIRERLAENVDVESVQLLYKQAIKYLSEFTTKENTLNWFLKKEMEVIDINHLLKIDSVLINVI